MLEAPLVGATIGELRDKSGTGLLGFSFRQLQWFLNRFDRLTFPMRRGQEYEADTVASRGVASACIYQAERRSTGLWEGLKTLYSTVWSIVVVGALLWLAYDWLVSG